MTSRNESELEDFDENTEVELKSKIRDKDSYSSSKKLKGQAVNDRINSICLDVSTGIYIILGLGLFVLSILELLLRSPISTVGIASIISSVFFILVGIIQLIFSFKNRKNKGCHTIIAGFSVVILVAVFFYALGAIMVGIPGSDYASDALPLNIDAYKYINKERYEKLYSNGRNNLGIISMVLFAIFTTVIVLFSCITAFCYDVHRFVVPVGLIAFPCSSLLIGFGALTCYIGLNLLVPLNLDEAVVKASVTVFVTSLVLTLLVVPFIVVVIIYTYLHLVKGDVDINDLRYGTKFEAAHWQACPSLCTIVYVTIICLLGFVIALSVIIGVALAPAPDKLEAKCDEEFYCERFNNSIKKYGNYSGNPDKVDEPLYYQYYTPKLLENLKEHQNSVVLTGAIFFLVPLGGFLLLLMSYLVISLVWGIIRLVILTCIGGDCTFWGNEYYYGDYALNTVEKGIHKGGF